MGRRVRNKSFVWGIYLNISVEVSACTVLYLTVPMLTLYCNKTSIVFGSTKLLVDTKIWGNLYGSLYDTLKWHYSFKICLFILDELFAPWTEFFVIHETTLPAIDRLFWQKHNFLLFLKQTFIGRLTCHSDSLSLWKWAVLGYRAQTLCHQAKVWLCKTTI